MNHPNLEPLRHGMRRVRVSGVPNTPARLALIEEAVGIILDGGDRLRGAYLGIKNYDRFGDQRSDHEYGMCPRHGNIVFRVEMPRERRGNPAPLTDDEKRDAVLYLLAERDFEPVKRQVVEQGYARERSYNLADCLEMHERAEVELEAWAAALRQVKAAPEADALRSLIP